MKALILAGGFGTRLEQTYAQYEGLHKDKLREWVAGRPKGLVVIQGRPILDYVLDQVKSAGIDRREVYLQTNAVYHAAFCAWATQCGVPADHVFNNGVVSNDTRCGTIGDLRLALDKIGYNDPVLVVASDTLVWDDHGQPYDFGVLARGYQEDGISRIVVYPGEPERLSSHGIVQVSDDDLIVGFEEKPARPKSNLVNASVHLYSLACLASVRSYDGPKDRHGDLIVDLLRQSVPMKAVQATKRLDVGTIDDVLRVNINP
ncbi:TPA: NTP transferase domain-containing protein [Candidatus Woesearchaeota archaeon]|nr:NTP transferase domain-containing protein [Candidatus Woesearchaeota archaeon]